jgi:proteasome component ECM29
VTHHADTDNRQEKTLSACVSALFDAPNCSKLSSADLSKRITSMLPLVLRANAEHAKDVHLTTFRSVQAVFERLPTDLVLDAKAKELLEKILFDSTYEGLPEAMRVKRAEALIKVAKVDSCKWIVDSVKPQVEGAERSPVVRGILAKVGKE